MDIGNSVYLVPDHKKAGDKVDRTDAPELPRLLGSRGPIEAGVKPTVFPKPKRWAFPGASVRSDSCNPEKLGIGPDQAQAQHQGAPRALPGATP